MEARASIRHCLPERNLAIVSETEEKFQTTAPEVNPPEGAAVIFDVETVKKNFPIFSADRGGRELVYLDSAATSQKPRVVIDALTGYYERSNANVHRGVYQLAEEATRLYEGARQKLADFIGASTQETILVRNATEAINLVAYSWGRSN